jgi:hypothetical protein
MLTTSLGPFFVIPVWSRSPVVLSSSWLSCAPLFSLALLSSDSSSSCCRCVWSHSVGPALSHPPSTPRAVAHGSCGGCWLSLVLHSPNCHRPSCSTRDPPYDQWLVGLGWVPSRSPSSPRHCWCRHGGRPSLPGCRVLSPSFPCTLIFAIPVVPSCHHRSTHHPPHEQLLVRLEAGGVGVAVPRCLLLTSIHLHPRSTLPAVARRRGAGAGCTGPIGLLSWVYRIGTHRCSSILLKK